MCVLLTLLIVIIWLNNNKIRVCCHHERRAEGRAKLLQSVGTRVRSDFRWLDITLPDIDFCRISGFSRTRYPVSGHSAGYLIIFNKKIKLNISINFCFVPSYFIMLCLSYFLLIRIFCDWLKLIQESRLPTSLCISITNYY